MAKKNLPRMQHYLPQGYLRGFTDHGHRDKKGHLRVIDLLHKRCFTSPTKGVASIRDYYVFKNNEGKLDYSFETDLLSKIDGDLARVVRQIEQTRRPPVDQDWKALCLAVAFLEVRTPHFRQVNQEIAQHYLDMVVHFDYSTPEGYEKAKGAIEEATGEKFDGSIKEAKRKIASGCLTVKVPREEDIDFMLRMAFDLAPIVFQMTPHLVFAADKGRFVTGDAPVFCWDTNQERRKARLGGVGFATPEVEVSLPLTSRCCLVLNWDGDPKVFDVDDQSVAFFNRFRAFRTRQYVFFPPHGDTPVLDMDGAVVWGEDRFLEHFGDQKASQPSIEIMGGPIPRRPPQRVRR